MRGYRYYYTGVSYDPQQVVDGLGQRGVLAGFAYNKMYKYYSGLFVAVLEWP